MPRKQSITKEQILQAAFEITLADGHEQVSARSIAKLLGCSTQPIYTSYPSMAELLTQVTEHAWTHVLNTYLVPDPGAKEQSFFSVGMGYVRFSLEAPNLFRLLFLSGKFSLTAMQHKMSFQSSTILKAMRQDRYLQDLPDEALESIHSQMWIFTHGIASLLFNDPSCLTKGQIAQMLHDMGAKVILWEIHRHKHAEEGCPFNTSEYEHHHSDKHHPGE